MVVDHDPAQTAGSSSVSSGTGGDGGAEAYCQGVCLEVHELAGIQCPPIEECVAWCVDPYKTAEALGCLDEYIAIWTCTVTKLVEQLYCPIECEDEYGALALCQNPDQK